MNLVGWRNFHGCCTLGVGHFLQYSENQNVNSPRYTGGVGVVETNDWCIILLDLKTTCDLIDHQILLRKLSIYKCSDESIKWFKSYLLDRNQCTSFKGKVSEKLPIEIGVPQGSILGHLLFIVFINDPLMSITNSTVDIYADDSTAIAKAKTTQELIMFG